MAQTPAAAIPGKRYPTHLSRLLCLVAMALCLGGGTRADAGTFIKPDRYGAPSNPFFIKLDPYGALPNPFTAKPNPFTVKPNPYQALPNPFTVKPNPYEAWPNPFSGRPDPIGPLATGL
jgi:hypothetical protein